MPLDSNDLDKALHLCLLAQLDAYHQKSVGEEDVFESYVYRQIGHLFRDIPEASVHLVHGLQVLEAYFEID